MKILLIDVNCKYSSTGKIVYDLYSSLRADGIETAICYGRGKLVEEPNIFKFSNDKEVYFHAFMTRLTGLTGYFSFFATRKLIRFIEEFQPDVIHIHELHGYFVNIGSVMEYIKRKNIKTVWTFHCEFMYTGRCGYAYECNNWEYGCGSCPDIKEYPSSYIFDFSRFMYAEKAIWFERFNDLIITAPSAWLISRVKQSFLHSKESVVVHNGIDTLGVFYPRENVNRLREKNKIKKEEKILLAVAPGIMQERKGGKFIIELAEKLQNQQMKVIMIGIEDLSETFPYNVIPLGRTENQDELAQYYSLADVFVICSKMENFPTVCLEALCCGTPICGFDVGGTAETAPAPFGKFVPYGDIGKLADVVIKTLEGENLSEKCAKFGAKEYSKAKMYSNFKELYFR